MLLSILVSALVSSVVSMAVVRTSFHSIDRYVKDTTENMKDIMKTVESYFRETDFCKSFTERS